MIALPDFDIARFDDDPRRHRQLRLRHHPHRIVETKIGGQIVRAQPLDVPAARGPPAARATMNTVSLGATFAASFGVELDPAADRSRS